MSKQCPIRGCLGEKQDNQVFCRDHWFQVPKPIRDAIWEAYCRKDRNASLKNIAEAMRFIRDSKQRPAE